MGLQWQNAVGWYKKSMHAWKRGLRKETRGLPRHFRTKKGMPSLPAALKGCNILITLETSSSAIYMGEDISGRYDALGISERSASGKGGTNHVFRASAFSMGVIAVPDSVTRLGMLEG
jgi:hypothetical protein